MKNTEYFIRQSDRCRSAGRKLSSSKGTILPYLVVLLLIFGVLGVTIASLFSTATSSSATPNNARRAAYIREAGMRYAFSELRNSVPPFDPREDGVIDKLNTTTYTVDPAGSFTLNIFSPYFVAAENYQFGGGGGTLTLNVPVGKLTPGWMAKDLTEVWVINYDYLENRASARAPVMSWTMNDDTSLTVTVDGDIIVNKGERICFMVKPKLDQTDISANGDLLVKEAARNFFPEYGGAISINRIDYVYEQLVHEPAGNLVRLKKITAGGIPSVEPPFPLTVTTTVDSGDYIGDWVVLSPRNYFVIPSGTADTVTVEGTLDNALNIYDRDTVKPMTRNPDIDLNQEDLPTVLNQNETNTDFINIDNSNKTIDIGGGGALAADPEFGSVWFNADKAIGGKQGVCIAGACEFDRGVRVFFTLDYDGDADGLTFALISGPPHNTTSSSGGDVLMGELLGYGGDSRKVSIPANSTADAADFLDGTGEGLRPPKIALEFDTFTNNKTLNFCNGTSKVNGNRNDPFTGNQDAVQYVFWGFDSLTMPCRDYWLSGTHVVDHGSYDDNQHDSGELDQPWPAYTTSGAVRSTPAVDDEGTIYVGSDDGHLYAINPDGSLKWKSVAIGQVQSSPAIGLNGVVYVGTNNNWVYAFEKDSASPASHPVLYSFPTFGDVRSSPVIGAGGNVYVGSDDGHYYGLTPSLVKEWELHAAGPISYGRPSVSPDGIIYVSNRNETNPGDGFWIYALNPAQRELDPTGSAFPGANEWQYPIGEGNQYMPGRDPTTGTLYADASGTRIAALTPGGALDWEFDLGSDFDSMPVVGSDGTVYFGADNGNLYAINPEDRNNGEPFPVSGREWTFSTGDAVDTTPAVASDGTILVVSEDDTLYAVNPDGTGKWTFPLPIDGSEPTSSPTVGNEGIVYVGSSSNNKLYAINNFAEPRNFKDKVLTAVNDGTDTRVAGEIVTVSDEQDWLNGDNSATDPKGPWAVRLEVMRSLTPTASKYEYTLHAWIRQIDPAGTDPIFGTFYEDTRIEYAAAPHLAQTIELSSTEHSDFTRFLFGFTGATGSGTAQSAVIADFKLSFIRANDPIAGP